MADVPDALKYTAEHEWVAVPDGASDPVTVRIGITDYAQQSLGDVVYVSLPEVGAEVSQGDSLGEVESTKSVSDLFAPVAGTVAQRNEALEANPDLINSDPYGEGWIIDITVSDAGQLDALLDATAYGTISG